MDGTDLIERLAELEHEQWMHWAGTLLASEPGLSPATKERWRSCMVPYGQLPEAEKDSDRRWAGRILHLLVKEPQP